MGMTIDELQTVLKRPNAVFYSDGDGTLLYPFPHQGQMMTVYIQLLRTVNTFAFLSHTT